MLPRLGSAVALVLCLALASCSSSPSSSSSSTAHKLESTLAPRFASLGTERYVSKASECPGEDALVKDLEAGKDTPLSCIDVMYDSIKYFDGVFQENGIDYFVKSGTALGAFREHAIIAHDYDVDVGVLLDDVQKIWDLRDQFWADGFLMLTTPFEKYNNFQIVVYMVTDAVKAYMDENSLTKDTVRFGDGIRAVGISVEFMAFAEVDGKLVQVLCTGWSGNTLNTELGASVVSSSSFVQVDEGAVAKSTPGWKCYASASDMAWFNSKFTKSGGGYRSNSGKCEHTASTCMKYEVPKDMVFPTARTRFYKIKVSVPGQTADFLTHYFGADWKVKKRRY